MPVTIFIDTDLVDSCSGMVIFKKHHDRLSTICAPSDANVKKTHFEAHTLTLCHIQALKDKKLCHTK